MRVIALVLTCTTFTAAAAFAQTRPLLTEEATTAPKGSLVLEAGADLVTDEPNLLTRRPRDRWNVPELRLVYSPADGVEMDVEWAGWILARGDPDFGNPSDWGDVTLRAKVRFLEQRGRRPALGARFGVTLPETRELKGLGPNTLRMAAQLLVSKRLGRAALHANAGLALQDRPLQLHAQSDFLAWGVAVVQQVRPRLWLVAEGSGVAGEGGAGAEPRTEARAGVRFETRRVRWDLALRRGLAEADGNWGFTVGLAWTAARP